MPQLISFASAQAPWLLPAVGIALFVHKHFLAFNGADSQLHARARAGARSRPPKLKRRASKAMFNERQADDAVEDREQEQLDAAGLGHDQLVEWFTEDEVEALHQAQANPAALMSLLTGIRFAAVGYDNDSEWLTEEGSDEGLSSHVIKPLELLQDSGSPMSGISLQQHDFTFQHAVQHHQQCVTEGGEHQQQEQLQVQLSQQLLVHIAKGQQRHAEQQQEHDSLQVAAAGKPGNAAAPGAAATGAETTISDVTESDYDDGGDYFDPNDYFALSPAAAAEPPLESPGHFIPRAGALWATSYPPRFGEDLGADFVPDFEPDAGDLDWDFDAPDFDPGFDDEDFMFDVDELTVSQL